MSSRDAIDAVAGLADLAQRLHDLQRLLVDQDPTLRSDSRVVASLRASGEQVVAIHVAAWDVAAAGDQNDGTVLELPDPSDAPR